MRKKPSHLGTLSLRHMFEKNFEKLSNLDVG